MIKVTCVVDAHDALGECCIWCSRSMSERAGCLKPRSADGHFPRCVIML